MEVLGQFSPNGRFVAYASDESGRFDIYVAAFPGPGLHRVSGVYETRETGDSGAQRNRAMAIERASNPAWSSP